MQYQPETEQARMMRIPYTLIPKPSSLTKDPQVHGTRKILMILLGVSLAFAMGSDAIVAIVESAVKKYTGNMQPGTLIGEALISLLFDGFGLFVAYRYSATGLRVFAWLSIVMLVMSSIGIGLLLFLSIVAVTAVNYVQDESKKAILTGASVGGSIFIFLNLINFVLTVVIVSFAFKLARFIDANKHVTIQQV